MVAAEDRKSHSRSCGLQSGGCGAGSPLCRSGCVQSASGFPRRLAPPRDADPATSLAGGEGKNVCQTLEETDPREGDSVREGWRGCYLVEVGGGAGAVRPVHTPLHVCVGGLGATLSSHPGYEPLWRAAAWNTHRPEVRGRNIQGSKNMWCDILEEQTQLTHVPTFTLTYWS